MTLTSILALAPTVWLSRSSRDLGLITDAEAALHSAHVLRLQLCRLASFAPSMLDAAEEQSAILAQAADSDQPVDIMQHLAETTLNITGSAVFGSAVT